MSLGVVIKGPEGIVLAADSRVTLTAERSGSPPVRVNFDNATKLLRLSKPHTFVGAVTYGAAVIGLRTAHSFMPEFDFELKVSEKRLSILEYASLLSRFFLKQWQKAGMPDNIPPMIFIVGGYDPDAAYGSVYVVDIPRHPTPVEHYAGDAEFGMTWGGQLQVASRLIHGYDPVLPSILKDELGLDDEAVDSLLQTLKQRLEFTIPYKVLPLQDCVDLATLMVRTTIDAQNLAIAVRGVGGPIDVATVTRTGGLEFVQRKTIVIGTKGS